MDSDVEIISGTTPETIVLSSDDENDKEKNRNKPTDMRKVKEPRKDHESDIDRRVKIEKLGSSQATSSGDSSTNQNHSSHTIRKHFKLEKNATTTEEISFMSKINDQRGISFRIQSKIEDLFDDSPKRRDRATSSSSERHSSNHKRGSSSKNKHRSGSLDKDRSKRNSYPRSSTIDSGQNKRKSSSKSQFSTKKSRPKEVKSEEFKNKFVNTVLNPEIAKSEINDTIANDWNKILQYGLPDIYKDALLRRQTIPENCPLLKAPTLNAEILDYVINKHMKKRIDTERANKQNQLGLGLTAVGKGLSLLGEYGDNTETNENTVIKASAFIQQGCRILADLHYSETESRKQALRLKPPWTQFLDCGRDETLLSLTVSTLLKSQKFAKYASRTD